MATNDAKDSNLQSGVREMVSTLVHRLSHIHSTAKSGRNQHFRAVDGRGRGVTMLVGSNAGATMQVDLNVMVDSHGVLFDDQERFGVYANNNYQAVNGRVMLNENYTSGDLGDQTAVSDHVEEHRHQ